MATNVLLPCDVLMGNPKPTIQWYKGLQPVTPTNNLRVGPTGTLVIRSVGLADAGQYRCVAGNVAGNHSITVELTIYSEYSYNDLKNYSLIKLNRFI